MSQRQSRRKSKREAKVARQKKEAGPDQGPFFSRISTDWLVGGMIASILVIVVLIFSLRQVFNSSSSFIVFNQVNAIAVDSGNPDLMVLGDVTGLYVSQDGGANWEEASVRDRAVRAVFAASDRPGVFTAAGDDVILESVDGGSTWHPIATDLPAADLEALASDPLTQRVRYAFLDGLGMYRSDNDGLTWRQVSAETEAIITDIAVKPGESDTLYAFHTVRGLIKSVDGGVTYQGVRGGVPWNLVIDLLTIADEPDSVYAIAGSPVDRTFYRSADGGESWELSDNGLDDFLGAALATSSSTGFLYMTDATGRIMTSPDGGATWLRN